MMESSARGGEFTVRPLAEGDANAVLALLNEAFDRSRSPDWYAWKHLSGPWGPSVGWVAEDEDGVVAARLMTPWNLWSKEELVPIERAMDGGVSPRARRQGLFSRCVAAEMEAISAGRRQVRLVYSTSVPASREAYRKLGWDIRDVPHVLTVSRPVLPRSTALVWDDALDQSAVATADDWATAWTPEALKWRIDPRSGHEYHAVRLREADGSQGVIVRLGRLKGVPLLVVLHSWGSRGEIRELLASVSAAMRTPIQLHASASPLGGLAKSVGASTVSLWSPDIAEGGAVPKLALGFADLEGVM